MVFIGSDHAGFDLKEDIKKHLDEKGIFFKDMGCFNKNSCDYPDIAKGVCKELLEKKEGKAILVCGTGVGMSIVANKFLDIRAVCASDFYSVLYSRLHNDSNVLCLGARVIGAGVALELVDVFLNANFEGGRHKKRVLKINNV